MFVVLILNRLMFAWCYDGLLSKSFSRSAAIGWHKHQLGVFAGIALFIIIVVVGRNIIADYALLINVLVFAVKSNLNASSYINE